MPRVTLSYRTAGESHGPAMNSLVDGMPAGLEIDAAFIDAELSRRQGGYGRGGRQRIESDRVRFLAGVRLGRTIGAPILMQIENKDSRLDDLERTPPVHRPRPGHADLAGARKFDTDDCRNVLERASARETAARVAAGALARVLLRQFGIEAFGFVRGGLDVVSSIEVSPLNWRELRAARDASEIAVPDAKASDAFIERIHAAKAAKDTVGGWCEAHVFGVPAGLGGCTQWFERLDARIAAAVMGIQAFKCVEIGLGRECAARRGSEVHDPITFDAGRRDEPHGGFVRPRNNAGGIEGGMTNGMPIVVKGTMKPIATLGKGMPSVDLRSGEAQQSAYERSDVCAVAAASVVMENVVAFEIARAFLERFGGATVEQVRAHVLADAATQRASPKRA
ncbi:MAG: chorismate synthase [Phycisphaerae bacterium]|nr:chorismate synthase [Phycisphaerae bacterium]